MPPRRRHILASCVALALGISASVNATAPKFSSPGLYQVADVVNLDNVEGIPIAFADMDADKYTDVFMLNTQQTILTVHRWNHEAFAFEPLPDTATSFNPRKPDEMIIINAVPGDFNYDGKLDLLLMAQANPAKQPDDTVRMRIFYGNGRDAFSHNDYLELSASAFTQPFVLDFNGTMRPNLLGYTSTDVPETGKMSLWSPVDHGGGAENVTLSSNGKGACKVSHPHSNAFVDFNGDCLADLFLTCDNGDGSTSFQIWLNGLEGYRLAREHTFPPGAGQVTFADMDGDGTMDIVFPTCTSDAKCHIHIVHNKQIPLCTEKLFTNCRHVEKLCTADDDFQFDFSEKSDGYVKISLQSLTSTKETFNLKSSHFKGIAPNPLRLGDYNNDGYMDILAITTAGVRLLRSIPCDDNLCSGAAADAGRRGFELVTKGAESLTVDPGNNMFAGFLDLDEDGTLDILVATNNNGKYETKVLLNNYYNDAFFLKALVSNGVCPAFCPTGPRFPSPKPYGVSYTGATFKYTVFSTSGARRASQAAQLPQTSYLALQTPYALLGLGRTNNYLESFFVGISRREEENRVVEYQGVIPNSQLVVLPYGETQLWRLELYINPSSSSHSVMLVLIVSLITLVCVVGGLHYMEIREDERERRKALHAINFDAL
ncbi:hypothetical protein BC832DRAFT_196876 [Gaertneriomyces semiglobifer]|nr:hypothetical protein BC832DRAFT_196876 [Gaertneriomyces semiglobifer]